MDPNTQAIDDTVAANLADDLLTDLELSGSSDIEDEMVLESLESADEAAIDLLEQTEASYAEQASSTDVSVEAADDAKAQATSTKKKRAASTSKAPKAKVERDLSALPADIFVLNIGATPGDPDAYKASVISRRPNQKKIAEKFDNLFTSIAAGKKPSVYTMFAFGVLDQSKEITSSDLVAAMKASASRSGAAYNEGTARSQAGQMMALFASVGIATRNGQKLTMNTDSKIAERLRAL